VVHAALVSGQSIELQYQLENTGSWTSLGTSSTVGATTATFSFSGTVTGLVVGLRVMLTAASSAASPALYDVLVRYALSPATKREWVFSALFEGTAELPLITEDQSAASQTGAQMSAAVWALYQASPRVPVTFVDLDGSSATVYLVELVEKAAERSQRRGLSTRGNVRLVEA
jgi:hypothetical protein